MSYYGWKPYVPVAERRRQALLKMEKLRKKGQPVSPVELEGKTIARTFWGKAWCDNLERYSDYSNRLPRGRTYVRNGSVLDLQIEPGEVKALVCGSKIYKVSVKVAAMPNAGWKSICADCAGAIDSLVELLQGRFSKGVMERICQQKTGLFPSPAEIEFSCSCPDWASMCKHVAAVLYGVGARLDHQPELLFKLRQVNQQDLIAKAGSDLPLAKTAPATERVISADRLSELFGLEMAPAEENPKPITKKKPQKPDQARRAAKAETASKNPAPKTTSPKTPTPKPASPAKKKATKKKARPRPNKPK
jgi:uncharacterized Zn finger protein